MSKEWNFISAVVYIKDDSEKTVNFFDILYTVLDAHFMQYEIVAINESCENCALPGLRKWAKGIKKPLTIVNMSLKQSHEQCMNAGLDMAIGDYVYEFDSTHMPYPETMIWDAYLSAMGGNDIVTVCPKTVKGWSRMFYRVFNDNSNAAYELRTDAFRLVSRRAINRAHAISDNLSYRKATYASCGLKMSVLEFDGTVVGKKPERLELAMDSLILYTNFGYKFSLGLTVCMFLVALAELIYTITIWLTGNPILGWTTTMVVLTLGLAGLFAILTITLKYLTLILKLIFQKQKYLIESTQRL
ncbi:MAG: glycosyl transferase family 2 [Lachnospiraceae bacterium]|nr:glycosyl transferase family 2 [Lachnospiraceae bacterium]